MEITSKPLSLKGINTSFLSVKGIKSMFSSLRGIIYNKIKNFMFPVKINAINNIVIDDIEIPPEPLVTLCINNEISKIQKVIKYSKSICPEIDYSFNYICKIGNFDIAKLLLNSGKVNVNCFYEGPFRYACEMGKLEVAKWLCENRIPNIHALNEYAFVKAAENGHLELAKWLHSLGADIFIDDCIAFRMACINNHLSMAKWLYTFGNLNKNIIDNTFKWSCINNSFSTAKWLYENENINIRMFDDEIFTKCCWKKHIAISSWLCSLCKNYEIFIKNGIIQHSKIH